MNLGEYLSQNTHVNDITGCLIWDGDSAKGGIPIADIAGANIPVRKMMYESVNGTQPYRTKFLASCENDKCVKLEHILLERKEQRGMEIDDEKLAQAVQLREEGYRLDVIGDKLGVNASTISKWIKYSKSREESAT